MNIPSIASSTAIANQLTRLACLYCLAWCYSPRCSEQFASYRRCSQLLQKNVEWSVRKLLLVLQWFSSNLGHRVRGLSLGAQVETNHQASERFRGVTEAAESTQKQDAWTNLTRRATRHGVLLRAEGTTMRMSQQSQTWGIHGRVLRVRMCGTWGLG